MDVTVEIKMDGKVVCTDLVPAKVFSSGSRGFFTNGKITSPDAKRYQIQVQLVEIGSKPKEGGPHE